MSERAYKAKEILFETVADSTGAIMAVKLPERALQEKLEANHGGVVSFFLDEPLLVELIKQMAFCVQRRKATDRLWTPGMPL